MNKPDKVFLLSNIIIVGFFIAIIFHYFCANVFKEPFPFNTFLEKPSYFFSDIKYIIEYSADLKPYSPANPMINYFPLIYFFLYPFTFINNYLIVYCIFIAIFLYFMIRQNFKWFYCKEFSKEQNIQNIFILTFMAYPVIYILDRGNIDMLLIILFTSFIYCFSNKSFFKSSFFLAVLNAIKPYFLPFILILIYQKKWKELFLNLFLTVFFVISGFLLLHGNLYSQLAGFKTNLLLFKDIYLYKYLYGVGTCSSLFQALKLIAYQNNFPHVHSLVVFHGFIIFLATLNIIYFAWKEEVFWKRITLLTLYMSIFPYVIFDYKLLFLFVPLWLFVNTEEKSPFDLVYTILFGLLLIPKKHLIFFPFEYFSVIANPTIMLVFMGLIIFEQFKRLKGRGTNE